MPFYRKGDVRIRYEETGSGFPFGSGRRNSRSAPATAVFNAKSAPERLPPSRWTNATPMVAI